MATNLEKYKKDLDRLVKEGTKLLKYISDGKRIKPEFFTGYQSWYTEAHSVIKQTIPDRISDFESFYKHGKRKNIDSETYSIDDYLNELPCEERGDFSVSYEDIRSDVAYRKFAQQISILQSAIRKFESSLFDIKQLAQADLFDSELDAARELNKKGFIRGAGAIAGVVLEGHLSQVCESHKIKVTKKKPTINDFNQLLKDNDVIETHNWRFIQRLADLRNLCDHNKKREPKKEETEELTKGVEKIIKTIF